MGIAVSAEQCGAEGCERPSRARGYCQGHYFRWRRGSEINGPLQVHTYPPDAQCSVDDCAEPPKARWLCKKHHARVVRNGDIELHPPEPRWSHGTRTGWQIYGCQCDLCEKWHDRYVLSQAEKMRDRRASDPEVNVRTMAWMKSENDRSREKADRNGFVWTGPELEMAARDDLTAKEVAAALGRTIAAVHGARKKLRHDPKTINHAGIGSRAHE